MPKSVFFQKMTEWIFGGIGKGREKTGILDFFDALTDRQLARFYRNIPINLWECS
jgi:hypothetical protein